MEVIQASCPISTSLFFQRASSTSHHVRKMRNNAFVGSTRHFDNEIDLASSEGWFGRSASLGSHKEASYVFVLRHAHWLMPTIKVSRLKAH